MTTARDEIKTPTPTHPTALAPPATSAADLYTLWVDHVTKRYGGNTVVDDLSFTVQPGRVTGFLGPNGSGKSTTMKILLDLAASDGGRATIGGRRYRDFSDPTRTVGVILEPNAFHPGRSGRDHLRILADATGIAHDRVDEMLESVDLAEAARRHAGAYSLGMRQRLSLAAAMLGDPPVLILDEPANGLDPQGIRTLRDLLRDRAVRGNTIFVSSHLLSEMEHLADDIVVINRGRLVSQGPLSELQDATCLVRTASPESLEEILRASGATSNVQDPETLVVRGLPIDEIGELAFRAGIALHELAPHSGSLEALFLDWTGGDRGRAIPHHTWR
jgi:ABC-2 type transport system ATP-binding protein